jgi:phosphoadenosine phosphosulfate reductase
MKEKLKEYRSITENFNTDELLAWALNEFGKDRLILSSSLSLEDQVLTHLLLSQNNSARILTLDTGRNFQETYNVMQSTMERYSFKYEVYAPDTNDLEELVSVNGPNLFYESIERRKLCCDVRKVRPLKRALSSTDAWITGLRREQSVTRSSLEAVEWDEAFGIFKINPLWNWTLDDTKKFIREKSIPYNPLFDKGFMSIGCAPCTRAVREGEDERSGRWWWENPDKKECGLHVPQSPEVI